MMPDVVVGAPWAGVDVDLVVLVCNVVTPPFAPADVEDLEVVVAPPAACPTVEALDVAVAETLP